jgi:transposase
MSTVTKKGPGQPTKLTPERMNAIVTMLEAGGYIEEACEAVGIGRSTYYSWLSRGQEESDRINAGMEPNPKETPFLEFLNTVSKANAEGIMGHVLNIDRAAKDGTWQASAWILERKQPHKWGRRDRTEVTGEGGGPIHVNVSTEELERKVARILERRALEA